MSTLFEDVPNGGRIRFSGDSRVYVKYGSRAATEYNGNERHGNLGSPVLVLKDSRPPGLAWLPRARRRAEEAIIRYLAANPFDSASRRAVWEGVPALDRRHFKTALERLVVVRLVTDDESGLSLTGFGVRRAGIEGYIRLG